MQQAQTISTGNVKVDIFMSSLAGLLVVVGNMRIDIWLQRMAWMGAIIVSIATIAKIFVIDFQILNKKQRRKK